MICEKCNGSGYVGHVKYGGKWGCENISKSGSVVTEYCDCNIGKYVKSLQTPQVPQK